MNPTKIEWTDFSSNPLYVVDRESGRRGWSCEKISPGCAHCYASALNVRRGTGHEYLPANRDKVEWRLNERELEAWVRRRKPARIFVCDMTDLFHEDVPDEFIDRVFGAMLAAKRHTFQVLTKRPERMRDFVTRAWWVKALREDFASTFSHVWLGVSAENQRMADERIPVLLDTPAAVRFVSYEPALGPVNLNGNDYEDAERCYLNEPLHGEGGLDWVIVGGESGPGYRPMKVEWLADIVAQCHTAGVPVWVKQDSGPRPGMQGRIPDDLWAVKEMP